MRQAVIRCGIVGMGFLLLTISSAKGIDTEATRATLQGLKGVHVVVEDLDPDVERDGLTQKQFRTDVELRLRKGGIRVLTREQRRTTPGHPYLVAGATLGSPANLGAEGLKLPEKYGAFIVTANIREHRQTRRHPHEHLLFWARRPMSCAPGGHRRVPHPSVDPARSGHPLARSCRYGAPRSATHHRQGNMVAR